MILFIAVIAIGIAFFIPKKQKWGNKAIAAVGLLFFIGYYFYSKEFPSLLFAIVCLSTLLRKQGLKEEA